MFGAITKLKKKSTYLYWMDLEFPLVTFSSVQLLSRVLLFATP